MTSVPHERVDATRARGNPAVDLLVEQAGDWWRAETLFERALAQPETAPDGRWDRDAGPSARSQLLARVARGRLEQHHVARSLDAAFEACRDDPGNIEAQKALAAGLLAAWSRRELDPGVPCSCASGRTRGDCCGPREAAALGRFEDRSLVYELRDALRPFLDRAKIAPFVVRGIQDWYQDRLPGEVDDPDETEARLAIERALVTEKPRPNDGDHVLLDAFADDPATACWASRRAREWRHFARFGLWEVVETTPEPGLLLRDLVTGEVVFTAVPPEQVEGLVPRSVALGAVMPTEGVWRTGAGLIPMTPDEGRTLLEDTLVVARRLLPRLVPNGAAATLHGEVDVRRTELRAGIPIEGMSPISPALAEVLGRVLAGALPMIRNHLRQMRERPVDVRNHVERREEAGVSRGRPRSAEAQAPAAGRDGPVRSSRA